MAEGMSTARANTTLAEILASAWVQLHVGAPGPNGTANVATNATRVDGHAAFAAPAGGSSTSSAVLDWLNVPAVEDYTHITVWDAQVAGAFQASGTVTANAVAIGDDFKIPVGGAMISLPVAS
jgi:hypothetical protein